MSDVTDKKTLQERLRNLRACEPGCEGRCEWCPDEVGREAATALDTALSERDAAMAREAVYREALEEVEWGGSDHEGESACPSCGGPQYAPATQGVAPYTHAPDCKLAEALSLGAAWPKWLIELVRYFFVPVGRAGLKEWLARDPDRNRHAEIYNAIPQPLRDTAEKETT